MPDSPRREMPTRRHCWTQRARVGGQTLHLTAGEYEDGTLGEVFLDVSKAGSGMRALVNALAISMSLGLQHGVPLRLYIDALRGIQFEPSGGVEGSPVVAKADSILDYVARELEAYYLAPPAPSPAPEAAP
jgi:ribonucleoside-diphosphate reductase alpha chain